MINPNPFSFEWKQKPLPLGRGSVTFANNCLGGNDADQVPRDRNVENRKARRKA
jgi:hypothetical protein